MDSHKKLVDLIGDFDTAMLVTRNAGGAMDARPMAVAQVEEDGQLWFVTNRHSGKVADLKFDSEVAITMQTPNKFVSLSGIATIVDDQSKLDALWQEAWRIWFPEGKASESIILIRIQPTQGEYWDNSGLTGLKYLLKAGAAYLHGEKPEIDASTNATAIL